MQNLKNERRLRKLTQAQLAKALKVSLTTYQNWENGITEPRFEKLKELSKYLNVSTDYLLDLQPKSPFSYDEKIKIKNVINIINKQIAEH
jgi:transcriptional regulator with XRE-family HTH domain